MKMKFAAALVIFGVLGGIPLFAHHSFSAEYDRSKNFTVTGSVTKVDWMNPHVYIYVDVKDDSGKVTNWAFELGNLSGMMRQGWRKDSLKPGQVVTVSASRAKDGSNLGASNGVTLADGKPIFRGAVGGEGAGN